MKLGTATKKYSFFVRKFGIRCYRRLKRNVSSGLENVSKSPSGFFRTRQDFRIVRSKRFDYERGDNEKRGTLEGIVQNFFLNF